jgi:hypothetical protein
VVTIALQLLVLLGGPIAAGTAAAWAISGWLGIRDLRREDLRP